MSRQKYRGTVYLVCFADRLCHAKHYVGWTKDKSTDGRLEYHRKKRGSRLLAAVVSAGIAFDVARVWKNADRNFERKIKNRKNATALCPNCNPNAMRLCRVPKERANEPATGP